MIGQIKKCNAGFADKFNELVEECWLFFSSDDSLFEVDYRGISMDQWTSKAIQQNIKQWNEQIFNTLNEKPNLYAIYAKTKESNNWELMYIGHSSEENIKTRITNHLVGKHKKTGSVLNKIKESVDYGAKIGVKFIKIAPESLRVSIEAELIRNHKNELPWNINGKGKSTTKKSKNTVK
jgi:sRNA-binding carbon storage regulator CsrA